MKAAERVLTERPEGRPYLEAEQKDVSRIHFTSTICNIFMDDGSVITVSRRLDGNGLEYHTDAKTIEVTP